VVSLVRRVDSWSRVWHESGRQFRQLAERTSDVVLLCDLDGVIKYASHAVGGYGYTPEALRGKPLADLLHPDDRAGGMRAVRRAVFGKAERVGRYPCRVRAADGSWRHVQSTVSLYIDPGHPDRLLLTARDMSAQVALRRQVTHLTFHDGLTGLPNRAYVEQRVREAAGPAALGPASAAQPAVAGVILLDLDRFTAVNAAVGHSAGDVLLAQAGRRVRAAVPPQDTVARWGGDEFAVLIGSAVSTEEIADIAQRLARSVATPPFQAGDTEVSLTVSVGVALTGAGPAGDVWRKVDMAMSRAKEHGGGQVEIYVEPDGPGDAAGPGDGAGPGVLPGEPRAPAGTAGGPAGASGCPAEAGGSPAGAGSASGAPGQPQAAAR
jgi:diguanylate cyclase (GGDEF)-like protein/PAS domain S-box-containing protein